jgi:hypothetical protein
LDERFCENVATAAGVSFAVPIAPSASASCHATGFPGLAKSSTLTFLFLQARRLS